MLYDLNLVWTPQTTAADLERALRFSQALGYDVVALNHIFGPPIPPHITNPEPRLPPQSLQKQTSNPTSSTLPTTLRRATVTISDPASNHRLPLLATSYDILAVRPTTEKAFTAACTSWTEPSIISLDLSTHLPFRLKPKPCMAAIHRGLFFEISYGQLIARSADARTRAAFIANAIELLRATKGRGIVISSEAVAAAGSGGGGGLRAPADVVNLFAVWGLGPEKGLAALGVNARAVVVNEGLRRRGFRGVLDVIQVDGRVPRQEEKDDGEDTADKKSGTNAPKMKGGGGLDAAGKGPKKLQQQKETVARISTQGGN